jgi:hypothetical protein
MEDAWAAWQTAAPAIASVRVSTSLTQTVTNEKITMLATRHTPDYTQLRHREARKQRQALWRMQIFGKCDKCEWRLGPKSTVDVENDFNINTPRAVLKSFQHLIFVLKTPNCRGKSPK